MTRLVQTTGVTGPKRLLTAQQAADMIGCHVETLRRAIRRRELLAQRSPTGLGRAFLIRASDLEAFLDRRRFV